MRIKEIRLQNGISQKELAAAIGVAPNTLSQYENGKRTPDFDTIARVSDYFHVSVDYLLGLDKKNPPPDGDGQSPLDKRLNELLSQATDETKQAMIVLLEQSQKQ